MGSRTSWGGGGNVPHPYDHVDGGPGASSVLVGAVNPGLVLVVPVLVRRVFEVRRGAEREVRFSLGSRSVRRLGSVQSPRLLHWANHPERRRRQPGVSTPYLPPR